MEQNYAEAARWYREAAEQGDVQAQFNLGHMYLNGDGVKKNREEAIKWYNKAVEKGDNNARRALERLGY